MSLRTYVRRLVPSPLWGLPADLVVVLLVVALTGLTTFVPGLRVPALRVVFGVPFVLWMPGYAVTAALFPGSAAQPTTDDSEPTTDDDEATSVLPSPGIDGIERATLSVVLSVATVVLLGILLDVSVWSVTVETLFVTVGGFVVACTAVAAVRRQHVPPNRREVAPVGRWVRGGLDGLQSPQTSVDLALNVVVVVGVLLAVLTVGFGVGVSGDATGFTELYLLTEAEDGRLVADDYPTNFTRGEPQPLVIAVENHEHESVDYSLVIEIQQVAADDASRVVRERTVNQTSFSVAHDGRWQTRHDVSVRMTGDRLRLTYLLYRGAPPANPTLDNAYREAHLWVTVSARGE